MDKNFLIEYPNEVKCKLGFLDFILRKWFYNPFCEEGFRMFTKNVNQITSLFLYLYLNILGLNTVIDKDEDSVNVELEKQKRRLKDMSRVMDQQHKLLRLIVQVFCLCSNLYCKNQNLSSIVLFS